MGESIGGLRFPLYAGFATMWIWSYIEMMRTGSSLLSPHAWTLVWLLLAAWTLMASELLAANLSARARTACVFTIVGSSLYALFMVITHENQLLGVALLSNLIVLILIVGGVGLLGWLVARLFALSVRGILAPSARGWAVAGLLLIGLHAGMSYHSHQRMHRTAETLRHPSLGPIQQASARLLWLRPPPASPADRPGQTESLRVIVQDDRPYLEDGTPLIEEDGHYYRLFDQTPLDPNAPPLPVEPMSPSESGWYGAGAPPSPSDMRERWIDQIQGEIDDRTRQLSDHPEYRDRIDRLQEQVERIRTGEEAPPIGTPARGRLISAPWDNPFLDFAAPETAEQGASMGLGGQM